MVALTAPVASSYDQTIVNSLAAKFRDKVWPTIHYPMGCTSILVSHEDVEGLPPKAAKDASYFDQKGGIDAFTSDAIDGRVTGLAIRFTSDGDCFTIRTVTERGNNNSELWKRVDAVRRSMAAPVVYPTYTIQVVKNKVFVLRTKVLYERIIDILGPELLVSKDAVTSLDAIGKLGLAGITSHKAQAGQNYLKVPVEIFELKTYEIPSY